MSSFIIRPVVELFRPSVAGVLHQFVKAQAKLEKIAAREKERSARLQIKASEASMESFRARQAASKLAALTQ